MNISSRRSSSVAINRMGASRSNTNTNTISNSANAANIGPSQRQDDSTVLNATATSLPRSVSYPSSGLGQHQQPTALQQQQQLSNYERLSSDSFSSGGGGAGVGDRRAEETMLKDSFAKDPFVSISRAIQSAKIRASNTLRNKGMNINSNSSNHSRYYHYYNNNTKSSRSKFAYYYTQTKKFTKLLSIILIISFILSRFFFLSSSSSNNSNNNSNNNNNNNYNNNNNNNNNNNYITSTNATNSKQQRSFWPSFFSSSSTSKNNIFSTSATTTAADHVFKSHLPSAYQNRPSLTTGPWLIALVTDLDKESCRLREDSFTSSSSSTKVDGDRKLKLVSCTRANTWVSHLKRGVFNLRGQYGKIEWVDETVLESHRPLDMAENTANLHGNRAMELSDLTWFHGHLLSPDDRTGAVLEISSPYGALNDERARKLLPNEAPSSHVPPSNSLRLRIRDDDNGMAFKAEWMTIKNDELFIGGHGRAYTNANGDMISEGPLWVKVLTKYNNNRLEVTRNMDWKQHYEAVKKAIGLPTEGFLMHECILWSDALKLWVLLPRRKSISAFDTRTVGKKGWNGVILASEDFSNIRSLEVADLKDDSGTRGFSAATFVPGTGERVVLAVRTVEVEDTGAEKYKTPRMTESYISAFNVVSGQVVMQEQNFSDLKFEGLSIM